MIIMKNESKANRYLVFLHIYNNTMEDTIALFRVDKEIVDRFIKYENCLDCVKDYMMFDYCNVHKCECLGIEGPELAKDTYLFSRYPELVLDLVDVNKIRLMDGHINLGYFDEELFISIYSSMDEEEREDISDYYAGGKKQLEVGLHDEMYCVEILNVIFNKPATIVSWSDGTKTVVKALDGEIFDKEKGLAMAICKKTLGNTGCYYEEFKQWISNEHD